ncbi:MAG: hypothetical protein FWG90_11595 [Oscillospiraceae bacterium]|nr:hypothetical protein [Oscillospiraceae bacterium]
MTYTTGDTHHGFRRIYEFCKRNKTSNNDVLIILGCAYSIEKHIRPEENDG